MLAGGNDCNASLIDITNGKRQYQFNGHCGNVNAVGFVAKEQCITGSSDRSLKLWDINTGREIKSYGCESQISTLDTFSSEPLIITGHNDGSLRIYSNRDNKVLNLMKNVFDSQITCVKLSFNNHFIVTSNIVCFGPNDNTIISGNWDSSLIGWNVNGGARSQMLYAGKDGAIICVCYNQFNGELYAGDSRGNMFIYH